MPRRGRGREVVSYRRVSLPQMSRDQIWIVSFERWQSSPIFTYKAEGCLFCL